MFVSYLFDRSKTPWGTFSKKKIFFFDQTLINREHNYGETIEKFRFVMELKLCIEKHRQMAFSFVSTYTIVETRVKKIVIWFQIKPGPYIELMLKTNPF